MPCTVRCRRSRSPKESCRCACGGTNHGVEAKASATGGETAGAAPARGGESGAEVGIGGGGPNTGEAGTPEGAGPRTNVGITPYQPEPEGPDDPRYGNLEELEGYYEEQRYKDFERDLRQKADSLGLRVVEVRRVAGVWEGEFEPAVSVEIEGDVGRTEELSRTLGSQYQQYGVVQFAADENGPDALWRLDGVSDRERAGTAMQELGFPGGRFDGDRLEILDFGRDGEAAVFELSRRLGATLGYLTGNARLLEKGEDYR